MFVGQEHKEK